MGNSCVEGREVKCFNVIVWGIVVSKVEKSNVLMLLCGNSCVEGREVKCFNVIVWGIVVSKVEKSNVLMLLCGE